MQQHPVPQHIASYEFRLVGDMTLKQFGLLASGCLVAVIFYASGLPGFIKWPLILFFVILGVAMAFVPIENRPFHQWIISFFKAVYSPTQFIWQKKAKKLPVFERTAFVQKKPVTPLPTPSADQAQLSQFLQSLPQEKTALEKQEDAFLEKIGHFFDNPDVSAVSPEPAPVSPFTKPLVVASSQPSPSPTPKIDKPLPELKVKKVTIKPPVSKPEKPKSYTAYPKAAKPKETKTTKAAKTSLELPFPQTPKTPNLIIGMVFDKQGKIIENAIIEIRDEQEIPVRALKTNRLGQFRIVTPLKNGEYEIETEKEGFIFDIIKINLKGEPVPPIEIRAQ